MTKIYTVVNYPDRVEHYSWECVIHCACIFRKTIHNPSFIKWEKLIKRNTNIFVITKLTDRILIEK